MSARLYSNQVPGFPDETDNTYNLGNEVVIARDCYVVGGGRYSPVTAPSNLTPVAHHLWTTGGSKLAEVTYVGAHTPGEWAYARYATPIFVAAGTHVVSAYGPTNAYVAFIGLFDTSLVNGDITAPAAGTGTGPTGRFTTNTSVAYPDQAGGTNGRNGYGADILIGDLKTGEVTALLSGVQVAANGLAIPAGVAPPTAAGTGWDTLRGIYEEARGLAEQDAEREADPVDCPNCGWPLSTGPSGVRYCPHGDYVR